MWIILFRMKAYPHIQLTLLLTQQTSTSNFSNKTGGGDLTYALQSYFVSWLFIYIHVLFTDKLNAVRFERNFDCNKFKRLVGQKFRCELV